MSNPGDSNQNLSPEMHATKPSFVSQETLGGKKKSIPTSSLMETGPIEIENLGIRKSGDTSSKSNVESVSEQLKGAADKTTQAVGEFKDEGSDQYAHKIAKEEGKDSISQDPQGNKSQDQVKEFQDKECVPKESEAGGTGGIPNPTTKMAATAALTGAPVFVESDSIIDLIITDHNMAKELFENYKQEEDLSKKRIIANELIKNLVAHDECEQLLVYPLIKDKINGGKNNEQIYDRSLKEHQEHRELLYQVKNIDIHKEFEKYDTSLKRAMASVLHHVALEESEVLPYIQEGLTEKELKKVGASFKAHKPLSATRPHPSAPQTGLPAAAGNILLAPFDALKDFIED